MTTTTNKSKQESVCQTRQEIGHGPKGVGGSEAKDRRGPQPLPVPPSFTPQILFFPLLALVLLQRKSLGVYLFTKC